MISHKKLLGKGFKTKWNFHCGFDPPPLNPTLQSIHFNMVLNTLPTLDEAILASKTELHEAFRRYWTREHSCDAPGCGKILVMDGGLKPHRKLCASKLSGVREFESTGLKVVTGCTKIPRS